MISEQHTPQDTNGEAISTIELTRRILVERMPEFLKTENMRRLHKQRRTLELAQKVHRCGVAVLPLPNFAALTEIERLECVEGEELEFIAECIFILSNQTNEDVLFLRGPERRKAVYAACKNIHAHNAADYLACIREMLDAVKKKQIFSHRRVTQQVQTLTQQISSLLSPKPSDNPPATS